MNKFINALFNHILHKNVKINITFLKFFGQEQTDDGDSIFFIGNYLKLTIEIKFNYLIKLFCIDLLYFNFFSLFGMCCGI